MDIKKLETIMKLMRKHHISELSLDDGESGEKLQLKGFYGTATPQNMQIPLPPPPMMMPMEVGHQEDTRTGAPAAEGLKVKPNQTVVRSPFVGTYYSAPSPGADPFVKVGHKVKKGDVLCIVEAMKLMNEIEADSDGIIVEILVQNEEPVEYNQPIFIIE